MRQKIEANRYIQLTEAGLNRLEEARRRYRKTIEDIIGDRYTPSTNTVKRALKRGAVFQDTVDRIWDYLQRCAEERNETLPDLRRDEDYVFVESAPSVDEKAMDQIVESLLPESRWGWLSRQVPRPNRLFTGRRDVLERLHTGLKTDPTTLVRDPQALTGMGGMGKTQTATAYIYMHRSDYNGVYWVSAESVEALNDGLAGLAEEIKLMHSATATRQEALQKIHDWFQNTSDWLLVLDNADDLPALAPHFPRYHTGSLLLTTRARNTVRWAAAIELVKFNRKEGALLLLRRAGILDMSRTLDSAPPAIAQAAMELSDEMDGLPLALEQAGAYLSETMMAVPDYLARYRKHGLPLLERGEDYDHNSVTVTFDLALEQVEQRSGYGPAAVELVRLCAFLAPDVIPEAIFTTTHYEEGEQAPLYAMDDYVEISAAACRYSLLSRDPKHQTLSMHRLVQKAMQETMQAEERRAWAERAVNVVSDATPDFEFDDWPLCDLLLPHWRRCVETIHALAIETEQAAYLLYQAGRYLRARARYEEAETLLRDALAIAEKVFGARDSVTADFLDALACLCRELDRAAEAEPLHKRALEIVEEVEGPDQLPTAAKLHNLGLCYLEQQNYAEAEACFVRALAIHEALPETDTRLMAAALTQLAGVYRARKEYVRAEPFSRRALELHEKTLSPNDVNIASACNSLGLLCLESGRYEEAEALLLRALKINEQERGKEHPETGTMLAGLAQVRWKQARLAEANALFQRALHIYETNFGPGHSRAARLLALYADFQQETGHNPRPKAGP